MCCLQKLELANSCDSQSLRLLLKLGPAFCAHVEICCSLFNPELPFLDNTLTLSTIIWCKFFAGFVLITADSTEYYYTDLVDPTNGMSLPDIILDVAMATGSQEIDKKDQCSHTSTDSGMAISQGSYSEKTVSPELPSPVSGK